MGVTIHFEGRLKTVTDLDKVVHLGLEFAKRKSSEVIKLDSNDKLLKRVKYDKDWDYRGEVKGIQFQPHESSDPLVLEFDRDLYIQEYCKTQFAGISTHIEIVPFLREIESYFDNLIIVDEGEFWETNDIKVLEQQGHERKMQTDYGRQHKI
jgi:hypothetical protein